MKFKVGDRIHVYGAGWDCLEIGRTGFFNEEFESPWTAVVHRKDLKTGLVETKIAQLKINGENCVAIGYGAKTEFVIGMSGLMKCAECGREISSGTYVNGRLCCDWCLPKSKK